MLAVTFVQIPKYYHSLLAKTALWRLFASYITFASFGKSIGPTLTQRNTSLPVV